jgi:hypothetical protein
MYDIPGVKGFKGFPSAPLITAAGSRPDFAEHDVYDQPHQHWNANVP